MAQDNNIRPGYMKTKIGWIPEDWQVQSFNHISKVVRGASPRPAGSPIFFNGTNIPWITVAELTNNEDKYLVATQSKLTAKGATRSRVFPKGTLLLVNSGATLGVPKITCIEACGNDGIAGFLDLSHEANINYLYYFLCTKTRYFRDRLAPGLGQPNLNTKLIGGVLLPLPPLPEQEAIAEVLNCWDKAIRTYEQKIGKKRDIKKGVMQRLLSGKKRLPGFTMEWKEMRLENIVDLIKNKVGKKIVIPMSLSAGIGFVPQSEKFGRDISGKQYEQYTLLQRGCFTYNKGNSKKFPQGCIYLLEDYDQVAVPNVFISFRLKSAFAINAYFKQVFLSNMHGRELVRYINSGVRNDGLLNLNTSNFLQIKIHLPSIQEQRVIAGILSDTDTEINALGQKFELLKAQRQFLLNNLVTGTIRLPQFVNSGKADSNDGDD